MNTGSSVAASIFAGLVPLRRVRIGGQPPGRPSFSFSLGCGAGVRGGGGLGGRLGDGSAGRFVAGELGRGGGRSAGGRSADGPGVSLAGGVDGRSLGRDGVSGALLDGRSAG